MTIKMTVRINGKEYHSVEEMPPDVRALYESAMAFRAKRGGENGAASSSTFSLSSGFDHKSMTELPDDVRKVLQAAMMSLDANGNGVIDLLETIEERKIRPGARGRGAHELSDPGHIRRAAASLRRRAIIAVLLILLSAMLVLSLVLH